MSIELLKENRGEVLDNIEKLLQLLLYVKLKRSQIEQVRMHLDALRLDPRPMSCFAALGANEAGQTRLILDFQPMDLVNGTSTH